MYRMMLFDIRGADSETAACEPLLRRLSLRPAATIHDLWLALRLLVEGRVVEAEAAYEAALAEQRQLGFFGTDALTEVVRAMVNTTGERWADVTEQLETLALVAPLFAQSLRVWTLAAAGRVDEARAILDADAPAVLKDWSQIPVLAVAAQAAVAAGHPTRMHWYYEHLLPYSGWFAVGGNTVVFGPVDYYLARLAAALGDAEASAEHQVRAESDCREAGLMWWAERSAALAKIRATSRPQVVR